MGSKSPTPPPKFNIGDIVYFKDVSYRVTNRRYTIGPWKYDIEEQNTLKPRHRIVTESLLVYSPLQDNQTVTNEQGARQSFVSARFDCIPPVVLRLLAQCLGFGARKYGDTNYQNISIHDHLNHAMNHVNEWNRGDRSEPHLVNAMARLTFALWHAVDQKQQPDTYIHPDEKQS